MTLHPQPCHVKRVMKPRPAMVAASWTPRKSRCLRQTAAIALAALVLLAGDAPASAGPAVTAGDLGTKRSTSPSWGRRASVSSLFPRASAKRKGTRWVLFSPEDLMLAMRVVTTPADFAEVFQLRRAVFVGEQNVDEAIEFDEHDRAALDFAKAHILG